MAVCFRPLQGLRWNKRSRPYRLKISRDYSNDPDETCKQDLHFGVKRRHERPRERGETATLLRVVVIVEVIDFLYT